MNGWNGLVMRLISIHLEVLISSSIHQKNLRNQTTLLKLSWQKVKCCMKKHRYATEIGLWLDKARGDLTTAQIIVQAKAPAWTACFHCQQVAEKALKGLLLYATNGYPKEHDLVKLAQSLKKAGVATDTMSTQLKTLTDYYVGTRYPTKKSYELTHREARKAIQYSEHVLEFVERKIVI